jgi:flagellar biosynthesis chaperone FliJ
MTKLNWQNNELTLQFQETQRQATHYENQINDLSTQIDQSSITIATKPCFINPEIEMSRLHFITKQHEKIDKLTTSLNEQLALEMQLKEKLQRNKTELNMLEKYLQRTELAERLHHKKMEEQTMDEWALQKRERL